jgi:biopolymer transport protein ExbD
MRIRHAQRHRKRKTGLSMTPMIDVVFLLLIFFIMTFRIVLPEGAFNLGKMKQAAAATRPVDPQLPALTVRLSGDGQGRLNSIRLNGRDLAGFDELRSQVRGLLGDVQIDPQSNEGPTVEFDCDYGLAYEHVIAAVTAVSGYVERGKVVGLLTKIRFARPRVPEA